MPSPLPDMSNLIRAAPAPSTPLGPFRDSFSGWTTWITLMGFFGLVSFALAIAGPAARRIGRETVASTTALLARTAAVVGVLSVPAVLADVALGLGENGSRDFAGAWDALYDGSNDGRLLGLEVTFCAVGALLLLPLTSRRQAAGPLRPWLLWGATASGVIALGTTKFPAETPTAWGRTIFDTTVWMLHLFGGAVWLGGLTGLLLLALPAAMTHRHRRDFFSPAIRRFSVAAMGGVAAITLSGLWLYWEHVDGPSQLFTTMYGRVLGVKIIIFSAILLLGMVNQFWLHPRIDQLRAAGDDRSLLTLLTRRFPLVVAAEVVLGLAVLMVAPFLHGSARNQAFQAQFAEQAASAATKLPKIAAKVVGESTWIWGTTETLVVIAVMVGGFIVSGRLARRRVHAVTPPTADLARV